MELPAKPGAGEVPAFMKTPNNLISEYTNAHFESSLSIYEFIGMWMKRDWSVQAMSDSSKFDFAMMKVKDNHVDSKPRKIGSLQGIEVVSRFKIVMDRLPKPQPTVIRLFTWRQGNACLSLQTQYLVSEEKQALKEYERILTSFKMN
jgi:hypothetical protein